MGEVFKVLILGHNITPPAFMLEIDKSGPVMKTGLGKGHCFCGFATIFAVKSFLGMGLVHSKSVFTLSRRMSIFQPPLPDEVSAQPERLTETGIRTVDIFLSCNCM